MRSLPVLAVLFLLVLAPPAQAQGCSHHLFVSGYFSNNVAIYDACSGAFLRQLETARRVQGAQAVRLNPVDGLIYVVSENNGQIQRYRRDANYTFVDVFAQLASDIGPTGVDFSADGRVFVASYGTSRVLELDRVTGQVIGDVLPAGSGLVGADNGMMVSAAGLLYVPGYDSSSIARVDLATGQVQGQFVPPRSGGIFHTRGILDEGETILVTGEGSGAVYRYNANTGAFVSRLASGMTKPTGIAIGTDGALLVLWGNRVNKYDRTTGASRGILANGADGGISGGTFLAVLPNPANDRNLGITRIGGGSGTVTSSPLGINCGNACSASFANGTRVTLTARPAAGNRFDGWSGACSGTSGTCTVTMDQARSVSASFATIVPPSATLLFDSASGPTTKTIVRNSGTPVTFAWTTRSLPSGTTCRILRLPNDDYNAIASPVSGGTRTDTAIQAWGVGQKVFYLRCSNGIVSPEIVLTIGNPTAPATATLRFDGASGPTTKTIVRNSGTPVTFAWSTQNLPSGTTCKILLRPNDTYNAAASPVSGGTRTDANIQGWAVGQKRFYLRCSNGTTSPDITLTIGNPTAPATATLRFDGAGGPTTKTIVRNSATPVTFAWATQNLPSGTTCRILLRPNDSYNAAASPVSGGTRTDTAIQAWGAGQKVFYLRCSNGTASPDIALTITPPRN